MEYIFKDFNIGDLINHSKNENKPFTKKFIINCIRDRYSNYLEIENSLKEEYYNYLLGDRMFELTKKVNKIKQSFNKCIREKFGYLIIDFKIQEKIN